MEVDAPVTWDEGYRSYLSTLTEQRIDFPNRLKMSMIPSPSEQNEELLKAAGIKLPPCLSSTDVIVATYTHRKKSA
jgi:hypothetical protein